MRKFQTALELIASRGTVAAGTIVEVLGWSSAGDGGAAQWRATGATGAPSQTPSQRGSATLTDASGIVWELVHSGQIQLLKIGSSEDASSDDTAVFNAASSDPDAKSVLITRVAKLAGAITPAEVNVYGMMQGASGILHDANSNTVMLEVSEPINSFLNWQCSALTASVLGTGTDGIKLPKSANTFSRAFKFDISDLIMKRSGGSDVGWSRAIRVGDAVKGRVDVEIRGNYDPTSDDAGQFDGVGVEMDAAQGCIAVEITSQIVNCRRGVSIENNIENFFLDSTEIVNGWIGVDTDDASSDKPGGYFGSGLHINCNFRGLRLRNRRDFNVASVQFYRDSSYFDHGLGWVGADIDGASKFSVVSANVRRVASGVGDTAFKIANCSNFSLAGSTIAQDNLPIAFDLQSCDGFTISATSLASGIDEWFRLDTCSNYEIGGHQSTDASLSGEVYTITGDLGSGSINRKGAAKQKFEQAIFSSAQTVNLSINQIDREITYSLQAGGGAYVVDIVLPGAGMIKGDTFDFFVQFATSGLNPTIRFLDGASVRYTLAAPGSISDFRVSLVYNGAGWVKRGLRSA